MACLLVIFWITSYAWPHPNYDADLISRNYGSQVTERCLEFENTVYGLLPTEHSARLLQLNGFVTAGVTPSGNTNGYHRVFSREIKVATGTMYFTTGPELYTERSERQSIRAVIDAGSALALDIRTSQYFKDGNHRTCLLTLILYLAERGVILTSSFHVYRAYTIVSARFHPGNESNTLDAVAHVEARSRVVKYLRRRTVRGVATAEYLAHLADTVRQLPIIVSRVEEVGTRLRDGRLDRSTLSWAQKVVMKWTFPEFYQGRCKLR